MKLTLFPLGSSAGTCRFENTLLEEYFNRIFMLECCCFSSNNTCPSSVEATLLLFIDSGLQLIFEG